MKNEMVMEQENAGQAAFHNKPASGQNVVAAKKMKRDTIIYWSATGIVSVVMLFSIISFNMKEPIGPDIYKVEGPFAHLKLPDYMRIELTVAKSLGLLALLIPAVPVKIKEFAYFGFAITLVSASFAHFSVGDGLLFVIDPLLFLGALIISYVYFHRLRKAKAGGAER